MRKKGETGVQDRGKPQPRKKKEREDARKKKKLARDERQQSRQAQIDISQCAHARFQYLFSRQQAAIVLEKNHKGIVEHVTQA